MNTDRRESWRDCHGPGPRRWCWLLLVVLAASGCQSEGRWTNSLLDQTPAADRQYERFRPPAAAYSPTTQPHLPTTRPDAASDLDRALAKLSQLDYDSARAILSTLEGRLLLARDIERAPQAAFWLAFSSEKLGLADQAAAEYRRVLDRYPDTPQARPAADRLARLLVIHAVPPTISP